MHASLRVWLNGSQSKQLEVIIEELLAARYTVYLTSDHGHTEAYGMGQPQEGVTVQTRSKRARLYTNYDAAKAVQDAYPQTILWESQQLLPADNWVLMPETVNDRRLAFATESKQVVTHGGISIDEMIVPLVGVKLAKLSPSAT